LRLNLRAQLALGLEDIFPFAGARCERMTKTILGCLGLSIEGNLSVPEADRPVPILGG
jgi:hypothetical protein